MNRPHIVVLHRWRDRYAHYERYVDHSTTAVSYVTTEVGTASVPSTAAEIATVSATDDLLVVRTVVDGLASRNGTPDAIVALKEDDLLVAAKLAECYGCGGRSYEQLLPFRDKLLMADRVAATGVVVPAVTVARDQAAVRELAASHGWPVVIKPRWGSSSAGVHVVTGERHLARIAPGLGEDLLVQQHVEQPIFHVDGLYRGGGHLGPWRASRYLGSCLDFRDGAPLGSVEEDDTTVLAAIERATRRILVALSDDPTPFHLELFVDQRGDAIDVMLLEIGARVGGSEIPFLWREVHGYDLLGAAFQLAIDPTTPLPEAFDPPEIAGWLLLPAPAQRPCRITSARSMVGHASGPYAEVVLEPGSVLPDADAYYEHVGARFRFRGTSTEQVAEAVVATAAGASVTGEPLEPGSPNSSRQPFREPSWT